MSVTRIEISKEYLHFAAGHFTIFDAENRENLHGHNFHMSLDATADIGADGITFDYNILKKSAKALCDELDEHVLLPGTSPHLSVSEEDNLVWANFADERIPFLTRDVKVLPIANITVEALAEYLSERLLALDAIKALDIHHLVVRCASGDGQWAATEWSA